MMTTYTYMNVNEWAAIYRGNELWTENHRLSINDLPLHETIAIHNMGSQEDTPLDMWVARKGGFPKDLMDALTIIGE